MTELELYKFIEENESEIHWDGDELLLWVNFCYLREFTELLDGCFDEGGELVYLQEDCIVVDLVPICELYDINPENIEEKGN